MGLFDRQRLFGGERLTELVPEGQQFVLYDIAMVVEGNTVLVPGSTVDKTELIISANGGEPVIATTLSRPIGDIALANERDKEGKPVADDLPALCLWKRVDTKNNYDNQATVLEFTAPFVGKVPKELPAFSHTPITRADNPL